MNRKHRVLDCRFSARYYLVLLGVILCAIGAMPNAQAAYTNGEILFLSAMPGQKPNLYSVRPDGSGLRKITGQGIGCIGAAWSPDKKSIVMAIATKVALVQKRHVWRYNLAILSVRTGAIRNRPLA